ncbi:GNAT family N-acetyltransferase [Micromonospora sp. DT46]|uniref:GNAT family N-acetyltransferase n=1 Tax=Micromonospora sp. DT46 TaxID=3393435 RepID=UPI003CED18B6
MGRVVTEIRPVERHEVVEYLRALPFANGLPSWEPYPAAWHGGAEAWPCPRPPATREQLESWADELMKDETFRPQAAIVNGKVVGATAMLSLQVTAPGLRVVPMGGVTGTGVIATHRRQGLLRGMMQAMFTDALERGEAIAELSASEGNIYGRFGFSPATLRTRWEMERSAARLVDADPDLGSLELVDAATAREVWPGIFDRVRRARVGEIAAPKGRWAGLSDEANGTDGPLRFLIHRDAAGQVDGIANYRLPWSTNPDGVGVLVVEALEALTDEAYRAMWSLLLDFDLTRKVVAPARPADEPLRWMLRNPRAMRVTRQSDNLWVRVLDLPKALTSRGYDTDGYLRITVEKDPECPHNIGTWELEISKGEAECRRVDGATDLTLDIQALGSLYLGGMSAAALARAGKIRPQEADALATLSRLFRTDPEPFNSIGF